MHHHYHFTGINVHLERGLGESLKKLAKFSGLYSLWAFKTPKKLTSINAVKSSG
jgi:hypothetical protein